jgi:hypothetical protein
MLLLGLKDKLDQSLKKSKSNILYVSTRGRFFRDFWLTL